MTKQQITIEALTLPVHGGLLSRTYTATMIVDLDDTCQAQALLDCFEMQLTPHGSSTAISIDALEAVAFRKAIDAMMTAREARRQLERGEQ
jgi:hypothetical protein